jgi:hypothetical protein
MDSQIIYGLVGGCALLVIVTLTYVLRQRRRPKRESPRSERVAPAAQTAAPATPAAELAGALLNVAHKFAQHPGFKPIAEDLQELADDFSRPVMLVVMGQFKTGKSSFINALLGEDLLTVDVTPATAAVTIIRFGAKPKLTAVYGQNRRKEFPLPDLGRISAESDAHGANLRKDLRYLEVELPNKMLRRFTIVDTPGLNSNNALHTEATEMFMRRADVVFWLFAYGNVGNQTEAGAIRALGKDLRPIAVINRIDEHDPEEGSLDEMLAATGRRIAADVAAVIGVSARDARRATMEGNQALLAQSRWSRVEEIIERNLSSGGHPRKLRRLFTRLEEIRKKAEALLVDPEKKYRAAKEMIQEEKRYLARIAEARQAIRSHHDQWEVPDGKTAIFFVAERENLPEYLENYAKLDREFQSLVGVAESLASEFEGLERKISDLKARGKSHEQDLALFETVVAQWKKSGFFGGAPILESLFGGGEKARLENWQQTINSRANQLNAEAKDLQEREDAWRNRVKRASEEACGFAERVRAAFLMADKRMEQEQKEFDRVRREAAQTLERMAWVAGVRLLLDREIATILAEPITKQVQLIAGERLAPPRSWAELKALGARLTIPPQSQLASVAASQTVASIEVSGDDPPSRGAV